VLYSFLVFEKFKITHFYVFENDGVKYVDRYVHEKCTYEKVSVKIV
jgi:hypothetical protein